MRKGEGDQGEESGRAGATCPYCGAPRNPGAVGEEMLALEAYHEALGAKDLAGQAAMLRSGFTPDSREALAEAGIRCLPLIESIDPAVASGAANRLEAMVFKLGLLPRDRESRQVIERLEAVLKRWKREQEKNTRLGAGIIFGLVAIIALLALAIFFRVCR